MSPRTITLCLFLPALIWAHAPRLRTTNGKLKGFTQDAGDGLSVDVFFGIPFAEPPVGDLRFKPPQPAQSWRGTKDATQLPNSCWQIIDTAYNRFEGVEMWNPNTPRSEDCLYLNVFSPTTKSSRPKPIMVWIFGGGFWSGTTTLDVYNGTQLAARNDVIVVSIAYRLGVFGYLYVGSDDAPGNAGMLDQVLALQWVYDNAESLGGSKDSITIFGESAGAASVGFHLLSPLTRDLFTYAIMESSSPLCDWAIQSHKLAKTRTKQLAEGLNCTHKGGRRNMMQCLREIDPETLATKQWDVVEKFFDMPFGPVLDFVYLPKHPQKMMNQGDIKITSVLAGVNTNEGIYFDIYGFMDELPLDNGGNLTRSQFNKVLRGIVPDKIERKQVKEVYDVKNTDLTYEGIIDAVSGDYLFKCPVVNFAQQYSQLGGRVYMYSFEHRVTDNPWPAWMGVPHGYEVEVVFGQALRQGANATEEEKMLCTKVMDFWATFAATGDPNKEGVIEWPEYTNPEEKYLTIGNNVYTVGQKLRHEECAFWDYSEYPLAETDS